MKNSFKPFLTLLVLSLFFWTACDRNRIFDLNVEISEVGWMQNEKKHFEFEISDTNQIYNFFVNIRNSNGYAYRNIYLLVEMISPSEKYFMDTVEMTLADKTGKWLGSGIGNIWQNQIPLLSGVKLKEKGKYQVEISHGMRKDTLESITDIGIRVEKI